jgi:hypothetical protein
MTTTSRFKFRYPEWREIEPSVWLTHWAARYGDGDNPEYFLLIAKRGKLSSEDFEQVGRWKEGCLNLNHGSWKTGCNLAAAREQDSVGTTPNFDTLSLPPFDIVAIDRILEENLPSLDVAAAQVEAHLGRLGPGGETQSRQG